jgi:hypothetical protein
VSSWPAAPAEAAFHGPAGEFVARTEPHSEGHPMALLSQFLVAFGTACGRGAHYPVEADRHYSNSSWCSWARPPEDAREARGAMSGAYWKTRTAGLRAAWSAACRAARG